MKKVLSVILVAVMMLAVLPVASFAEDNVIDLIEMEIVAPTDGDALLTDGFCGTEGVTVTADDVKWFDITAGVFSNEIIFAAGNSYATYITFSADEGFVFTKDTKVEINKINAKVTTLAEDGKSLTATVTQVCSAAPVLDEEKDIFIDFIAPVYGEPALCDYLLDAEDCEVIETKWFEASSDRFIDAATNFTEGTYYMQVTFGPAKNTSLGNNVNIIINGNEAIKVDYNEDGTVTAFAQFECAGKQIDLSIFARIFNTIKSAFLTIIRFFGTMVGLR